MPTGTGGKLPLCAAVRSSLLVHADTVEVTAVLPLLGLAVQHALVQTSN